MSIKPLQKDWVSTITLQDHTAVGKEEQMKIQMDSLENISQRVQSLNILQKNRFKQ